MKILCNNPFEAVKATGGATFEPGIGWWTQAETKDDSVGRSFEDLRDAIYIPTLQKTGEPVATATIELLKTQARKIGLHTLTIAAGMWILSTTGEVQSETIWIAYGEQVDGQSQLAELASAIKTQANQDAVAWEQGGVLNFV